MSAIHDLINQINDPRLRERLAAEWKAASQGKKFGLVFEDHLPELLPLPKAKPRRGDLVCPRQGRLTEVWQVKSVRDGVVTCVKPQDETHPSEPTRATADTVNFAVDEVLVVREFGEPIFPSLVPVDAVENSPRPLAGEGPGERAAPWHTLIEADNYHALQLLDYLYAGKVDCIYIDPPYNTGARDWKYNNDYVDGNDSWRHSKWLSMMQRRLLLAKRLLNRVDSVLIVTIDEKEYLRLGLLLEQMFPEARIQMVTININPRAGVARPDAFTRTEEYMYVAQFGKSSVVSAPLSGEAVQEINTSPIWFSLMRTGSNSSRQARRNLFYPIWVRPNGRLHSVGDPLPLDVDRNNVQPPARGCIAIWPLRPDGTENTWQLGSDSIRKAFADGTAKLNVTSRRVTVNYLRNAEKRRISAGEIEVLGKDEAGALILRHREGAYRITRPRTVWSSPAHDAGLYGSQILSALIPGRKFPFPKSLYAVEDTLRFFVASKPNALILDFFAGSGTTAHAVMRLNRQDGGQRKCISVTNNEVAADEEKSLSERGLQPGDEDWEKWGICQHITFPRLAAAITGKTPSGAPIKGEYKFTDEFPLAEGFPANLAYFKLDFLDKDRVTLKRAFREILPLLWLKAGAAGPRPELARGEPEPVIFAPAGSNFVVLLEESRLARLMKALKGRTSLSHVFIVTDSDESFRAMAAEVREMAGKANPDLQVVQLYRDYLVNFMINKRQDAAGRAGLGAMPGAQP